MKDPYAHDFFVANRWLLKIAGLWRPENENNIIQFLYTVYVTIIFLYVNMFFMLTEFVSIFYVYGNQFDLIKNISWALTHFMGTVKVVFVNFQGHQLRKIMDNLENSKLHYEHCPSKDFFPGKISKRYKRIGITHTVVFLWMAYLIIILSYLPPVIAALISVANNTEIMLQQKLPYDFWTPFKPDTTTSYFLAVGFQIIPMFSYTHSVVGMDTLFTNIMNCIAMNLEIIQGAFISISPRAAAKTEGPLLTPDKLHNSDALTIKLRTEMKKVTKHLQVVYKACDDLEDVHKYLTLAQTTATLFILCSCLYVVSTTPLENKQFWAESLYMVAAGFELVLYCWFGNEITIKADNMPIYIWQCDWLTADKDFKMSLILNMARTKRQLYLTAGKFVPLTLPTFVSIMKVSYSFFTFIKNTE
ncbi:odorant receptor 94b-like [Diorhabda carinulata]|uniref:odorant receptor 94b-like n=1 Tax=Diorhabda carinulata TaxID=1163345 RepID=UPI0025A045ED|nr:odorant receptor 94b-like [Diorhabda carinulata]